MKNTTISSHEDPGLGLDSGRGWYESISDLVPCDRAVLGAISMHQPQPDEILMVRGWSRQAVLAWCHDGFEHDALLSAAKRNGSAVATADQVTQRHVLPVNGHTMTCLVPESVQQDGCWWWCQLGRRDGAFTAQERKVAQFVLRRWQVRFNHIPAPGLGRVVLGHDNRLIHADPGTQIRLLQNRRLLGHLSSTLHAVAGQRWPHLESDVEHDFAVELAGQRYWISFRRSAAIDEPTATRWCIELRPLAEGELPPVGAIDDPRIALAIGYLHDHYQESPSLTRIAEAVDVSPFHFHRLFTRLVGISPKRYLQRKQLQVAKWLLRSGRTPVGAIAGRTGFSSHGHFTSTFHRLTGLSPTEYRESD